MLTIKDGIAIIIVIGLLGLVSTAFARSQEPMQVQALIQNNDWVGADQALTEALKSQNPNLINNVIELLLASANPQAIRTLLKSQTLQRFRDDPIRVGAAPVPLQERVFRDIVRWLRSHPGNAPTAALLKEKQAARYRQIYQGSCDWLF